MEFNIKLDFDTYLADTSNITSLLISVDGQCAMCFTVYRTKSNFTEAVYMIDKSIIIKAISYYQDAVSKSSVEYWDLTKKGKGHEQKSKSSK